MAGQHRDDDPTAEAGSGVTPHVVAGAEAFADVLSRLAGSGGVPPEGLLLRPARHHEAPPDRRGRCDPAESAAAADGGHLDFEEWHNFLGNKGLITALLSRLRHQRHTVKIDGPSLREPQS